MRISLKRLIIFTYLILCAFVSFLNYHQSTTTVIDQSKETFPNMDDSLGRSGFWRGLANELKAILPNFILSGRWISIDDGSEIDTALWPEESNTSDRILAQIHFRLDRSRDRSMMDHLSDRSKPKLKPISIFLPHGLRSWSVDAGDVEFRRQQCPISNCYLTDEKSLVDKADAVLFRSHYVNGLERKSRKQIWIFYTLESPENTPSLSVFKHWINWTATYRFDSDLVTPYEKFRLYSTNEMKRRKGNRTDSNYEGKTRQVAWFVSNCLTNNRRHEYADQLARHIQVDVYGACGPFKCSRYDARCGELLNERYRFYLAFENSNCRDYITEKFFVHALQHNVIPIVMGAKKSDYVRVAPPHSFIHVDDYESPAELAAYLRRLSTNDTLYEEYFRWKGSGEFINTKFWCRLCAMLNAPKMKFYDIQQWWHRSDVCTRGRWTSIGDLNKSKFNVTMLRK